MPLKLLPVETPISTFEVVTEWMIGDADGEDFTSCLVADETEAIRRFKLIKDCIQKTRETYGSGIIYPDSKDEPWVEHSYAPDGCGSMNEPRGVDLYWYDEHGRKFKAQTDHYSDLIIT